MLEKLKSTYKGKKVFVSFLMLLFAGNAYAQSSKNALSFEFTPSYGYRFLVANDKGNFQKQSLGTTPKNLKKNLDSSESGIFTYSFSLNYVRKINRKFSFSAGVGYLKTGKMRTILGPPVFYQTTDGAYIPMYTRETMDLNSYQKYISVPVAVQYSFTLSQNTDLISSIGIIPLFAFGYSNPFSMYAVSSETSIYQTKMFMTPVNQFVLATEASLGINYKLNERFEFQFSPSYLQQITPGITYWDDLKQYNYNFGLKFGTKVNL